MNKSARQFTRKRAIGHSKKLFLQVLEYVAFCYNCLKQDNAEKQVCYSESYHKNHTSFAFEDWLKVRFIEDYLQLLRNQFHPSIKGIRFYSETEKTYKDENNIQRRDKIDIFITNLGLQSYWGSVEPEGIYFSIECKRLKNRSKNAKYLTDIQKFTEREYEFRFPFEGMIGFVEKSSISIDDIIDDINKRLRESSSIITTQELTTFEVRNFQYCRLSRHKKSSSPNTPIEVYHLFFNYAQIITP